MNEGAEDPRELTGDNGICPECGINHWLDFYEDEDDLPLIGFGLFDAPSPGDTVVSEPSDSLSFPGRASGDMQSGGEYYQGPQGRTNLVDA